MYETEISVDVTGRTNLGASIISKQGDGGLYRVKVHIVDGGKPFYLDPEKVRVVLSVKKPDGTVVLDDGVEHPENIGIDDDGSVHVLLTPNIQAVAGNAKMEIIILDENNNQITTAAFLNCIVPRAVSDDDIKSSDDYLLLQTLINSVESIKNGKSAYEIAVENGFSGTVTEWLASLKGDPADLPAASANVLGGIKVGSNLKIDEHGVLSVDTTDQVEQDNTKPVTSAAVHVQLGNVEALLSTI